MERFWNLGKLQVPRSPVIRQTAADHRLWHERPDNQYPDQDGWAAKAIATDYVYTQLLFHVAGPPRFAIRPVAQRLVDFSERVDWICQVLPARSRGYRDDQAVAFLAGMGADLVGGSGGAQMMQFILNWPYTDPSIVAQTAYYIWESRGQPEGQERQHWQLAQWLVKLSKAASQCVPSTALPNCDHALGALGSLIIEDPLAALCLFAPDTWRPCQYPNYCELKKIADSRGNPLNTKEDLFALNAMIRASMQIDPGTITAQTYDKEIAARVWAIQMI